MSSNTTNILLYKKDPSTDGADYFDITTMLNENWDKIDTRFGISPTKTIGNITYYVRADGSDSNDGSANDSAHAFLTIQKAITMLPQVINNAVVINVANGTYSGTVGLTGVTGSGTLNILGDTVLSDNVIINSGAASTFVITKCSIPITIRGFKSVRTAGNGLSLSWNTSVTVNFFKSESVTLSHSTLSCSSSVVTVSGSLLANAGNAIACSSGIVLSDSNTGSGNTIGLNASVGGRIIKSGTQPYGTTPESPTLGGSIGELVTKTSANITLYVRTDGNDGNDGLANTAGQALKTIQAAINRIPQVVNHVVTINVAAGTYTEYAYLFGFMGIGSINILGDTVDTTTFLLYGVDARQCTCTLKVRGLRATTTTTTGFSFQQCSWVWVELCSHVVVATAVYGVAAIYGSVVMVLYGTYSNKLGAMFAANCGQLNSRVISAGTGNIYGLYANGGTIMKEGTQPSGTTAEIATNGGEIR
jgi:hypothetical protein